MKPNKFAKCILPVLFLSLFLTQTQGVFAADNGILPDLDEDIQVAKEARANELLKYQKAKQEVQDARRAWEANKNNQTRDRLNLAIRNKIIALMLLDQARITVQILILEKDQAGRWGNFGEIIGSDVELVKSILGDLNTSFSRAGEYAEQMGKVDMKSEVKGNTAVLNKLKNEIVVFHRNEVRHAIRQAILIHKLYILKGIGVIAKEGGYDIDSVLEVAYNLLRDAFENADDKELFNSVKDYASALIQKILDGGLLTGQDTPPPYDGGDNKCPQLMPSVDSCPEPYIKVLIFSSPECGTHYGCQRERPPKGFQVPKSKDVK